MNLSTISSSVFLTGVTTPEHRLRNVPTQARSRERLGRVLAAAERVLTEEGASALGTTRVAQVAGVPVGSIYHLFGDKESIVDTLATRYWEAFAQRVAAVADADACAPLADPIGAIFETLADGFRSEPGFRALWYSELRTQRLRDVTRGTRDAFLGSVERILAMHWPGARDAERTAAARMVVLTGDGLLREAFRLSPEGDVEVLAECRLMVAAYLATRLGEPNPDDRTP
ncbi:MAG: TetR family transcriptional regulator [Solirubrobacterales bacterium]|nr:TetR family transcriptional regulator [Solirubrobacterales bacterium]